MDLAALGAYQPEAASAIAKAVDEGSFPQSVLYAGPRYSLKMTAALGTIKALSAKRGEGEDETIDRLTSESLLILSLRDHRSILTTALGLFSRLRSEESRAYLIHETRLYLSQYTAPMEEAMGGKKGEGQMEAAGELGDLVSDLGGANLEAVDVKKFSADYASSLAKVLSGQRKDMSLSIDQTRAIGLWTSRSTRDLKSRYIIIEGIDQAGTASLNSLLKILEEPPEGVTFFLLSENPGRILNTILSRVRKYSFRALDASGVASLTEKWHLEYSPRSFEEFFLRGSGSDPEELESRVEDLCTRIVKKDCPSLEEMAELASLLETDTALAFFLTSLTKAFERLFLDGRIETSEAEHYEKAIGRAASDASLYNLSTNQLIETLILSLTGGHEA